jgi:hypothetical protein
MYWARFIKGKMGKKVGLRVIPVTVPGNTPGAPGEFFLTVRKSVT